MHDPEVVAWEIPAPFPRKGYQRSRPERGEPNWGIHRWRYSGSHASDPDPEVASKANAPILPWYRPHAWLLFLNGQRFRAARFATIWHHEPSGADSGAICSHWRTSKKGHRLVEMIPDPDTGKEAPSYLISNRWRWHLTHLRVQLPWLEAIRRRLFTRCSWCHQRSGKGLNQVNCTASWDSAKAPHWYDSEPDLFHSECLSAKQALGSCTCENPELPWRRDRQGNRTQRTDYGQCGACGKFREWGRTSTTTELYQFWQDNIEPHERPTQAFRQEIQRRVAAIRETLPEGEHW